MKTMPAAAAGHHQPQAPAERRHPPPNLQVRFFSAGTAACIADLFTFPLDTTKVRLQIQGEAASRATKEMAEMKYRGMFGTMRTIVKEEGGRALYNGLVPGLQRQMCFASVRIGLYDPVKQFYMNLFQADGTSVSGSNVGLRILAGITTGAMAVSCAQPTDVVKVRLQAQIRGTDGRYKGTIHAYRTIGRTEGVRGLWKGTLPNITRNAIVNAAELVSYDLIKEAILKRNLLSDNMPCHFFSAFGAGFITTVVASPVDVVKTRFMNSGEGVYKGAFHCAVTMFKEGGFFAFYKGFVPSYMRLGTWNIAMFVCFEQIKRLGMTVFYNDEDGSSSKTNGVNTQGVTLRNNLPNNSPNTSANTQ